MAAAGGWAVSGEVNPLGPASTVRHIVSVEFLRGRYGGRGWMGRAGRAVPPCVARPAGGWAVLGEVTPLGPASAVRRIVALCSVGAAAARMWVELGCITRMRAPRRNGYACAFVTTYSAHQFRGYALHAYALVHWCRWLLGSLAADA